MHALIVAAAKPAGGAATSDIVLATAGAMVATVTLLVVGLLQRSGRMPLLPRLAALAEKESGGLPGWSSLPGLVTLGALGIALTGMYWDISLHIDNGRDPGPLANPAHYLI